MTDRIFRGDAVPVAQETKVVPASPEVNDVFELSINGKSIRYTAAEATVADVVAGLASAWNDSEIPEFAEVTASDEGNHVLLTADTAGVPFTVSASATSGSGAAGSVTVEETTKGDPGTNEVQKLELVGTYTGGTWKAVVDLGAGDETTAAINYNGTADDVQTALEGLPSVSPGDVVVTGGPGPDSPWYATWTGSYATQEVNPIRVDGTSLVGNTSIDIDTVTPGGGKSDSVWALQLSESTRGQYRVNVGGAETAELAYNATAADLQSAIEALGTVGAGNVTVVGGPDGAVNPDHFRFYIRFGGDLAGTDVDITANYRYLDGIAEWHQISAGGRDDRNEIQVVSTGQPSGGEFRLTVTHPSLGEKTTAALPYDATTDDVHAAIVDAFTPGIISLTVWAGIFPDTNADKTSWYAIEFIVSEGDTNIDPIGLFSGTLTGTAGTPGVTTIHAGGGIIDEIQSIVLHATGGDWTATFDGETTASIAYGATAATVETALEALSTITDVTVTGSGTPEDPYLVTFLDPGNQDVPLLTADASALTGGGGKSTESAAHSAAVDEQQTVTVDAAATGGDFTLSFRNAQTSAIAYDASAATVESALEALSTVDDVTVTGSAGGPYTVTFAGDLGAQDVPLMEADGSGLTTGTATESVSVSELTRSEGPNHWDAPRNWTGNRIPDSGDQVIIDNLDVDLLYGLRQRTTFTADASTDTLTMTDLADFRSDQIVRVKSTGTLPAGLSENTDYWIVSLDRDAQTLKLATSSGGAAVDITDAGTGTHTIVWQMGGLDSTSRYSGKLGLKQRNDDGDYWQYRPTHLECGVLDPGGGENKKAIIGERNGAGTSRLRLDFGDDPVDVDVHQTGGGEEPGVAACLLRLDNTACVVTHHDGELGIASLAGQSAMLKKLVMHGGTVEMDNVTITDIERNSGELMARNVSMSGTLIAR